MSLTVLSCPALSGTRASGPLQHTTEPNRTPSASSTALLCSRVIRFVCCAVRTLFSRSNHSLKCCVVLLLFAPPDVCAPFALTVQYSSAAAALGSLLQLPLPSQMSCFFYCNRFISCSLPIQQFTSASGRLLVKYSNLLNSEFLRVLQILLDIF